MTSAPKRVAILSVHTCPLALLGGKKTGGMNVYVRDFSRELGRKGILVDVFTRSQDDCQPMIKHDLGNGGRVIHIPAGPEKPIPVQEVPNYIDQFTTGVISFAATEEIKYDLIHSHYWISGLVAIELRQKWAHHPPFVHMFHTLGHMKNRIAQSDAEKASPARIAGEKKVIDQADQLIVATPAEQAQLVWLYDTNCHKMSIIPPGVDLQRFHPIPKEEAKKYVGIPAHHRNILFVGRIEPLKGIDTLLQAMAKIQNCHPEAIQNLCVAIIGGDPNAENPDEEMRRLQQLRLDLNIHDLVTFIGAKDQDTLPYYYAAADIVIMPSHYESFGMVALESMAVGTPVIASEVGGLAFLVRDGRTGIHVPSRDPDSLAERIYQLLTQDDYRIQLGEQAASYAQEYSWVHITKQIITLYKKLLYHSGIKQTYVER